MNKYDLTNVSFLIPIRLDSVIRIENILLSIDNILNHFKTNIYVLEAAEYCNGILKKILPNEVNYIFEYDCDPIFHRTKYLNLLSTIVTTPVIALWDADVIVESSQIKDSATDVLTQRFDASYPYDGRFMDTSSIIRSMYLTKPDIQFLLRNINKMSLPYGDSMVGGAVFVDTKKFHAIGGENENFYGWGPEDWERKARWERSGFSISRIQGPLFHLSHPRDINGRHSSKFQQINCAIQLKRSHSL